MLDATKRQELAEKLRRKVKKASSNVSTKVEAEKGDFKLVMSTDQIDHFYKNHKVASIKVADLSNDELQLINDDPKDAAHELLENFVQSFDASEFDAKTASAIKQSANETLSEKTYDMTTEKQLNEQKVKLHPRTNDFYQNITQKQLPEHGQRPGTYDVITEAQFRDERKTFYGADRINDWQNDDPSVVTEGQLNDGVDKYTAVGASDRGEVGVKFDGGVEKQQMMIGEKQLMELLKHHKWTEPLTITEGKDQLGKQDGELARLTAESANQIIKEALDALGSTVLAVGATPESLVEITKRLVSDPSKFAPLANTIKLYADKDTSQINKKIAKAKTFGKSANVSADWSEFLTADVLMRQLAKIAQPQRHIVDGLIALSKRADFCDKISAAADSVLSSKHDNEDNLSVFAQAIDGKTDSDSSDEVSGDESDGLYSVAGSIREIDVDASDRKKFAAAAAEYAKSKILTHTKSANLALQPLTIEVDREKGIFNIQLEDANVRKASEDLKVRAERRRELAKAAESKLSKEAQMGGGGPMPPAGGPEMANPAPPTGAGDMAPPVGETLSQQPPADLSEEPSSGGEPKPPGTSCPVCGSEDVDLDGGKSNCNNCGAKITWHVSADIENWPGTLEDTKKEDKQGFGLEDAEGLGSEEAGMASEPGGDLGSGTTMPNAPIAASVNLNARMLEKLAEQKINFGSVCPVCGSKDADLSKAAKSKGYDGTCWKCLQEFNLQVKASKKSKQVVAQYVWRPQSETDCAGCNRVKSAFLQSMQSYGISPSEFERLSLKDKADTILKLAKGGWLNLETVLETPLPMRKIAASARWKGYEKFDKFPKASCIERIARKYGENATSMSGPCQGKKLAECVCGQLESLGIYTDGLAAKVASLQSNKDPVINDPLKTCIAMFVKDYNYSVDDSCTICDGLRAVGASANELLVEAISQMEPGKMSNHLAPDPKVQKPKPMGMSAPKPMGMGAKPMEDHPLDEPVSDDGETGQPSEEPNGGMTGMNDGIDIEIHSEPADNFDSDDFGSDDMGLDFGGEMDLGFGDDFVTIQLPASALEALQTLTQALQGQFSDDMVDTTGDDMLDMSDINEEPVDDIANDTETEVIPDDTEEPSISEDLGSAENSSDTNEDNNDEGSDIPGLSNDSNDKDELIKEGPSKEPEVKDEPDAMASSANAKTAGLEQMLTSMKKGTYKTQQNALDSLFEGLMKQAKIAAKEDIKKVKPANGKDTKISVSPAQDTSGLGKIKDGGKIGHEEPFSKNVAAKPNVPRGDALLGDEASDMKVAENEMLPTVPHGSAAMDGEKHYRPEKGNNVDGNQGGQKAASNKQTIKTAAVNKSCKCGDSGCDCSCNSDKCAKPCPCSAGTKKSVKTASRALTVDPQHQYYSNFMKRANRGDETVKLTNGITYAMSIDQNDNIVLIPQIKSAQTVTPKKVDSLVDDKDLNPSSGAGAGKTHADKAHSLGVDEKKPSEGMDKPSVPEAPNSGRLQREHTVETPKDGPTVPAGGGMHPDYDKNEKNAPEKMDELLGKDNGTALASHDDAVKIAGLMLKANLINPDELPEKVRELSKATAAILDDYRKTILRAMDAKGMQRTASKNAVENAALYLATSAPNENKTELKNTLQTLFRLDKRNKDHERLVDEKGNAQIWR